MVDRTTEPTDAPQPADAAPPRQADRRATDRRQADRRRAVVRVAAVGDFHCGTDSTGTLRAAFARANDEADVLLLAGDLTNRGTPAEMRVVTKELADVEIPVVAVLGNHDHESGETEQACEILRERGVHLLDGHAFELNEHVGIAGTKGFIGGFGRRTLTAFGERALKDVVGVTLEEVKKLEFALTRLSTPVRIALLHYAPVADTVAGEPEQIYPFLGTDRLAEPLERFGVAVAFHGHAHIGAFRGATASGIPVFNVALPVLQQQGITTPYLVYEIPLPTAEAAAAEYATRAGTIT